MVLDPQERLLPRIAIPAPQYTSGNEASDYRSCAIHADYGLLHVENQAGIPRSGGNYLDRIQIESLQRYHVKKLQNLGFAVRIEPSIVVP